MSVGLRWVSHIELYATFNLYIHYIVCSNARKCKGSELFLIACETRIIDTAQSTGHGQNGILVKNELKNKSHLAQ